MADVGTVTSELDRDDETTAGTHFIRAVVENDLRAGTYGGRVVTRFPPEPNGYLHIGHAKSICLNFGLAADYGGTCNLRFDDTNPTTEDVEYVNAIKRDVRWLGFDWGDREYYASDYFDRLHAYAVRLIEAGKAYVDSLTEDQIREYRGTVKEAGRESPYRTRSVAENLDLFERMRAGEFPDGEHVLRARIDMSSPNMKMRDPLLYRIRHAHHYRTGEQWCIYPMYDFAHPLSDAIEEVTHSLCTLEFENNRELYDWVLDNTVGQPRPRQYEFARLNLDHTVVRKRKLLRLVQERHVRGWDDPRMPTLSGLRRRGVTPESIRAFCDLVGVARADNRVDVGLLEHVIRDDLNFKAQRVLCVLRPLKVVITNYPADQTEWLEAPYWPHDVPREGSRKVPFSREIYVDRDDFRLDPPKGYYRLAPGREVRLRYGYFIRCNEVVHDEAGRVAELRCTYDPASRGGRSPDGRRVRGTIHWVSAAHALPAEVRIYDRLFTPPDPEAEGDDFVQTLNPTSLVVLADALIEPSVVDDPRDTRYQFEREGYFWQDPENSRTEQLVFNRIVPLRDTWSKKERAAGSVREPTRARARETKPSATQQTLETKTSPSLEDRIEAFTDAQRARYERFRSMEIDDVEAIIMAEDRKIAGFFEAALNRYRSPRTIAKWTVNDLKRTMKGPSAPEWSVSPEHFADLVKLVDDNVVSMRTGKELLDVMIDSGRHPSELVREHDLHLVSDEAMLQSVVTDVLARHPDKVGLYRNGKTGLLGFFIGQVMQKTEGKAEPHLVRDLVEAGLKS